ncbi:MAG: biotin transporter BioY [candidate division WOR-3 bacterium]
MNITQRLELFYAERVRYFKLLRTISWTKKIGLSLLFALITGIFAQIRIPLGFTPVPVTGQVFAVLMSGVLLGGFYGGMSMVFYLLLGGLGVPWFAGLRSGLMPGPTLGYLFGFIPAAVFVGIFIHRFRNLLAQLLIMLGGIAIIYFLGAVNFAWYLRVEFPTTLKLAVLPFIPFDIAKAIIAGFVSRALIPDR